MAQYYEVRTWAGQWRPVLIQDDHFKGRKDGSGVLRESEYGPPIRGLVKISKPDSDLPLETLQRLYGVTV